MKLGVNTCIVAVFRRRGKWSPCLPIKILVGVSCLSNAIYSDILIPIPSICTVATDVPIRRLLISQKEGDIAA